MKTEAFPSNEAQQELSAAEKVRLEAMQESQGEASSRNLEQPIAAESIDGLEAPVNPDELLKAADASLTETQAQIIQLTASIEAQRSGLAKVRESLGLGAQTEQLPDEKQLESLKAREQKLEEEKNEAEMTKELEGVLESLGKLSKPELTIIIQTGKGPDGKELETKRGKINPEVAKKLAGEAEKGVTKLTKGLLKMLVGLTSVISAIFEMIGGTAGKGA